MKKIIATLIVCLITLSCVGCQEVVVEKEVMSKSSMFVKVEKAGDWYVVYHKETKVMYVVSQGRYNYGNFTPLIDENGKPLLWQGE